MGEAKRKNKQAQQVEESLRGQIRAGEFGDAGTMSHFCVVLDKSQRAMDVLKALRTMPEASALRPLVESLELQLWEASGIFRFALLASGPEGGKGRVLLAADLDKLDEVLPKVLVRSVGSTRPPGLLIAVADDADGVIQAKAHQLRSS